LFFNKSRANQSRGVWALHRSTVLCARRALKVIHPWHRHGITSAV